MTAMQPVQRAIRTAQHRLWLDRFLFANCRGVGAAAVASGLAIAATRVFALSIPIPWVLGGIAAAVLLCAAGWTAWTRESFLFAAARLDEAANLKERLSSAHCCQGSDDAFARAVVADAQEIGRRLSPRRHLRLHAPKGLGWTILALMISPCAWLIPWRMAGGSTEIPADTAVQVEKAKNESRKSLEEAHRAVAGIPDLDQEAIKDDEQEFGAVIQRPDDARHEALKKIDALADAVEQKQADEKFGAMQSFQRQLRNVDSPQSEDSPTQKLTEALRAGDFKSAKQEIKSIEEKLATLQSTEDQETVQQIRQQLQELSKQIEKSGGSEKIAQKLEQSGMSKDDAQRALENLRKQDLEAVKKELEKAGMSPDQAQKAAQQLQQQTQADGMAQKMAESLQQASQSSPQQSGDQADGAASGLSQAAQQLSELEQLAQQMDELKSASSAIADARSKLDQQNQHGPSGGAPGTEQADGGGMGDTAGKGTGGVAIDEASATNYKTHKAKVHTGAGAIIGQLLVDGEQVRGRSNSPVAEVFAAAERDASDRIRRDRIPRQYHQAIKEYFSHAGKQGAKSSATPASDGSAKKPENSTTDSPGVVPEGDAPAKTKSP